LTQWKNLQPTAEFATRAARLGTVPIDEDAAEAAVAEDGAANLPISGGFSVGSTISYQFSRVAAVRDTALPSAA
jgi:hypothetical protein